MEFHKLKSKNKKNRKIRPRISIMLCRFCLSLRIGEREKSDQPHKAARYHRMKECEINYSQQTIIVPRVVIAPLESTSIQPTQSLSSTQPYQIGQNTILVHNDYFSSKLVQVCQSISMEPNDSGEGNASLLSFLFSVCHCVFLSFFPSLFLSFFLSLLR